ncbi:MAG: MBL fold metallo-hydrolase [Burkholderiaceae bacterium]
MRCSTTPARAGCRQRRRRPGRGAASRSLRLSRLDRLVISHEDRDHAGGAAGLLQRFAVRLWMSSLPAAHPLRLLPHPHEPCVRGDEWTWDGFGSRYCIQGRPR